MKNFYLRCGVREVMVKPFQTGSSTIGNPKSSRPYIKFFKWKVLNIKLELFGKYSDIPPPRAERLGLIKQEIVSIELEQWTLLIIKNPGCLLPCRPSHSWQSSRAPVPNWIPEQEYIQAQSRTGRSDGFMFLLSRMSLAQLTTGMTMKLMIPYCFQTDAQLKSKPV